MVGIAVFGAGKAATTHLRGWKNVTNARVIGVFDPDAARAKAASDTFGVKAYADAEALLNAPGVDAADIATSNPTHRALARLAASHGKAVLCQKPLSISLDDAIGLVNDCEEAGVRLMANENWRWRPWYRAAKALIDAGQLGRLTYFRSQSRSDPRPYALLLNVGPHQLDVARFLFGFPDSVYARTRQIDPARENEDMASISLGYAGRIGQVDFNWASALEPGRFQPERMTIEGSEATLNLEQSGELTLTRRSGEVIPILVDRTDYYQRSFTSALAHFVTSLEAGTPFETSGRENLGTMRMVFGAYRSAAEGRPVDIR